MTCTLLLADGKFAGWKRGRDGSLSEAVLTRRCVVPVVLACMLRGDTGCRVSKRPADSNRGESGD